MQFYGKMLGVVKYNDNFNKTIDGSVSDNRYLSNPRNFLLWWDNELPHNASIAVPIDQTDWYRDMYLRPEEYFHLTDLINPTFYSNNYEQIHGFNDPVLFEIHRTSATHSSTDRGIDSHWDFSKPLVLPHQIGFGFINVCNNDMISNHLQTVGIVPPSSVIVLNRVKNETHSASHGHDANALHLQADYYSFSLSTHKYTKYYEYVLDSPDNMNFDPQH